MILKFRPASQPAKQLGQRCSVLSFAQAQSDRAWMVDTLTVLQELDYREAMLPYRQLQLDLIKVDLMRPIRRKRVLYYLEILPAILEDLKRCAR